MNESRKNIVVLGGSGRLGGVILSEISKNEFNLVNFSSKVNSQLDKKIVQYKVDLTNIFELKNKFNELNKTHGKIFSVINFAGRSKKKDLNFNSSQILNSLNNDASILLNIIELIISERSIFTSPVKVIDIGSLWANKIPKTSTYLDLGNEPDISVVLSKTIKKRIVQYVSKYSSDLKIQINQISPGWFPRPGKIERQDYIKGIEENIPIGRIGQPKELVSSIEYLLNDDTTYVNGCEITVDGGFSVY